MYEVGADLAAEAVRLGWGRNSAAALGQELAPLGAADGRAYLRYLRGRLDELDKRPSP